MLTCDSIRNNSRKLILSFIWLSGAAMACAQNSPELREVLARLDRLENDNRALTEEIRALRKELAGLHGTAAVDATAASAPASPEGPMARRAVDSKPTKNAKRSKTAALKSWLRPKSNRPKNFRSGSPGWLCSTLLQTAVTTTKRTIRP